MKPILLALLISTGAFAQSLSPRITTLETVYSLQYHPAEKTVGNIGDVGQIKAGHVLSAKSFPAAVKGVDKLAFWNLSADATDSSGETSCTAGAAACTLTNNGTTPFTGTNIFGASGAATFTGTGQFLSLPNTESFFSMNTATSFSIGSWINPTSQGTSRIVWGKYDQTSNSAYALLINSSGIMSAIGSADGGNTNFVSVGGVDLAPYYGTWIHVVMVWTGSSLKMYLNGQKIAEAPLASIFNSSAPFSVGNARVSGASSLYYNGSIQDLFVIRNAALADQDIRRLYSTRIDHNRNIAPYRAEPRFAHNHLGANTSYTRLPFVWYDASDANSLFADFSDLDATDRVDIRLYSVQQ